MDALFPSQAVSLDDDTDTPTGTGESDDITVVARSANTEARTADWSANGTRGVRPPWSSNLRGTIRIALYARFSSSLQNPLSVADQFDVCRDFMTRQSGWKEIAAYHDDGISGRTIAERPGIQRLLEAADRGEFDVLLAESLSRISRSYEMGQIYALFQFLGIRIITLIEGELNEVHIGMKGTMNSVHLKDHAAAVRRGQAGMTRHGRSMGRAYGYEIVKKVDADGEPIRGLRQINEAQAEIIRRIYREYVAGASAVTIARRLNDEEIPGPSGRKWRALSIRGVASSHRGILVNPVYTGKLIYNLSSNRKNPITGKRTTRLNPREEWLIVEQPDLRIVDQDLWDAAQIAVAENAAKYAHINARRGNRALALNAAHRPRTLLSGLLVCGHCGGSYVRRGQDSYRCTNHFVDDSCVNGRSITRTELEGRVFAALRGPLLDPDVLMECVKGYAEEIQRLNRQKTSSYNSAEKRLSQIERAIGELVVAFENGNFSRALRERLDHLEHERDELELTLASAPPSDIPVPSIDAFRQRIIRLSDALGKPERDDEAVSVIRDLIDHITITPELIGATRGPQSRKKMNLTLHGDLAKIFSHATSGIALNLLASDESGTSRNRDRQITVIEI